MKRKFTKLIAALALLVFMTPAMVGWGQTYTELFSISSADVVTNSSYTAYTTTVSNRDWVITFGGNNKSVGTNSGNRSNCNLGNYTKYAVSPVTSTQVASAFACTTSLSNVSKIKYTFNGGSNQTNTNVYLLYSANDDTYSQVSLTSGTQGATISSGTEYTFSASTGYFALLFEATNTSGNWRIDDVVITFYEVSGGGSSITAPTFDPVSGSSVVSGTAVHLSAAQGTTIYYTSGTGNVDVPTTSSSQYDNNTGITVDAEHTTIKAIASDGNNTSSVATATYTILTPLTTMQDIYDANTTSTDQYVAITFNNWIITGASSSYAFLSDGDKGLFILGSGHGFVQGDILSGTVVCKLKRNTGMANLTQLTSTTTGIYVEKGGNPTPTVTTINTVEGINTGKLITLNGLTCHVDGNTYFFTDDENRTVYPYTWGGLTNFKENLSDGKTYDVTGAFSYGNNTNEKRIHPRTVTEIMPTPTTLPFSWNGGVKADLLAVTGVTSSGLGSDYSADDHDPYLVKLDGTGDYIMVRTDSQPGVVTIGVKKIGGASNNSKITVQASTDGVNFDTGQDLAINGAQNAIVTLTSTREFSADVRYIRLYFTKGANIGVGPISITKAKYAITLNTPTTGGSFTADKASADAGEIVTLTPEAATHYVFTSWTVCKTGEPSTTVNVDNNQFVMPAYPVTVSATFTTLQERTIIIPTEIEDNVAVDVTGNKAYAGDEVTIMIYAPINEFLTSLTVTGYTTSNLITLSPEVSSEIDEYTFTMPDENVTIAATFAGEFTVQFSVNGTNTGSQTATAGNDVTLPSSPEAPEGFSFAGWTTNPTNFDNIITGNSYTPTADVTLYAVYSRTITGPTVTAYNKVSSISAGAYLIVCENSNVAFDGSRDNTTDNKIDASYNTIGVTIEEYSIASNLTTDAAAFTITAITDGYSIQSASGFYIGSDSYNNELDVNNETALLNTIDIDENGNAVIIGYSNSTNYTALRYNATSGQERFRYYKQASQQAIQLYKKETTTPSTTEYYTRIQSITGITEITTITHADLITVPSGAVLTITDPCTGGPENLIIKDGGKLITYSTGVQATVEKDITGAGDENWAAASGADSWYFIASPVDDASFSTATVDDYDLYLLDWANNYWRNLKNNENESLFANGFQRGTGYLYASKDGNTISVAGEIQPLSNDDNATVTLANDGWNLIGNPLTCKVTVDHSFGLLNNGSAIDYTGTTVNPFQGIVVWGNANDEVTFTKAATQNAAAPGNSSLQMTVTQNVVTRGNTTSTTIDNAVVSFNESSILPKFNMLEGNAKLYIPQGNEEYAIVSSEAQGEMPVNFHANVNGTYTLTVNAENVEMNYLHLIDNMTGADTDLLQNPSYTFNAKTTDYESRFRLVFAANNEDGSSTGSETFAFFSNGNWIISNEGEATLQVIDVTGRILSNETVNGSVSKNIDAQAGVYVLRLINGDSVRTQKIVVR